MTLFHILCFAILAGTLIAYCSVRLLRLPHSVGSLHVASWVALVLAFLVRVDRPVRSLLTGIHLPDGTRHILLSVALPLWLFATAFPIDVPRSSRTQPLKVSRPFLASMITALFLMFVARVTSFSFGNPSSWPCCLAFGLLATVPDPRATRDFVRYSIGVEALAEKLTVSACLTAAFAASVIEALTAHAAIGQVEPLVGFLEYGASALGGIVLGLAGARCAFTLFRNARKLAVLSTLALGSFLITVAPRLHISATIAATVAALSLRMLMTGLEADEEENLPGPLFWKLLDVLWSEIVIVVLAVGVLTLRFPLSSVLIGVLASLTCNTIQWPLKWLAGRETTSRVALSSSVFVPGLLLLTLASCYSGAAPDAWILPASYVFVLCSVLTRPIAQAKLRSFAISDPDAQSTEAPA